MTTVYTFLATLILLLSIAGIITARSVILRRRHRRMVEEAIRNGTYVPPAPHVRPGRVDLSQKPQLWEAYLGEGDGGGGGGGGWQPGSFDHHKKELDMDTNWNSEYSRDWESIKPICASYIEPLLTSDPPSYSAPGLSPPAPLSVLTPITHSAPRRDIEENRGTAEVLTTTPSLLSRARTFLNPNSTNVPASSSANDGTTGDSHSIAATNISMAELGSSSNSPPPPPTVRVAVLIAMPSPPTHGSSKSPPPSTSHHHQHGQHHHPLELSSSSTVLRDDSEERPLPYLEMGVADVVMSRSDESSSSWDNTTGTTRRRKKEEKTIHSRESSYAEP